MKAYRYLKFEMPAATPDVLFAIQHYQEIYDIVDNDRDRFIKRYGIEFVQMVEKVSDKASKEIAVLVTMVKQAIQSRLSGVLHISWNPGRVEQNWGVEGDIYKTRSRGSSYGWAGIYAEMIGSQPSLVIYLCPREGVEGCRHLKEQIRKMRQWKGPLIIPKLERKPWPYWTDPCLVFYTRALDLNSNSTQICKDCADATAQFLKLATPAILALKTK